MNTATSHRLLSALVHEGLLSFDPYAKTYHIGFELMQIAESAQGVVPNLRLRHQLRTLITNVARRTEESTYLSVRANGDSLCIDQAEGSYPVSANTLVVGARRPLGIGAGAMALLAALPEAEADKLVEVNATRYERYSGITKSEVRAGLIETREIGFAHNAGRIIPEVAALGMAFQILETGNYVAVSVASVVSRMNPERRALVANILREEIHRWLASAQ